MPGAMVPLALSDRGNEVVMCGDEFSGGAARLELWTITASGAEATTQWIPYEEGGGRVNRVRWAGYLDAERLVTLSEAGMLALWQLNPLKPLSCLQIDAGCTPAFSPDRRWLVCAANEQLGVVDLRAGKVLAVRVLPLVKQSVFAFSPSGARLACRSEDGIQVWDFDTGELRRKFTLKSQGEGTTLLWADEEYLLVGNLLVGADNQIRLWRYNGLGGVARCGAVCLLHPALTDRASANLLALKLPQAGAREQLNRAMEDPEFVLLQPGTTVRLNVDGVADAALREKVSELLTERLQARGYPVGAAGKVELQASTEKGKMFQLESSRALFPFIGPGVGPDLALEGPGRLTRSRNTGAPYVSLYREETLWTQSGSNIPDSVLLKKGESPEDWIREHEKPDYAWFKNVDLPRTAVKGQAKGSLGSSEVTSSGLR